MENVLVYGALGIICILFLVKLVQLIKLNIRYKIVNSAMRYRSSRKVVINKKKK